MSCLQFKTKANRKKVGKFVVLSNVSGNDWLGKSSLGIKLCPQLVDIRESWSYSKGHIDSWIKDEEGSKWRFTGFYGDPRLAFRCHSWLLLKRLFGLSSLPWIIGGDFNEVLRDEEKVGGRFRSHAAISSFRDAIDSCRLVDIGYQGSLFTWSNR
ncbi:hypothetical protein ACOSQ2_025717 [Xanthoceras sorbifolium]